MPLTQKIGGVLGSESARLELYAGAFQVLRQLVVIEPQWTESSEAVVVEERLAGQMGGPMIGVEKSLGARDGVSKVGTRINDPCRTRLPVASSARVVKRMRYEAAISKLVPLRGAIGVEDRLVGLDDVPERRLPGRQARRSIVFGITSHRQ